MKARRPLTEVLVVYAAVTAATAAITLLAARLPGLEGYEHLLVGAVFLVTAVQLARREEGGMRRFGVDLAGLLEPPDPDDPRPAGPLGLYDLARAIPAAIPAGLKETGIALAVCAVIFPPFVWGFALWNDVQRPFEPTLPEDFGAFCATQLLVIALPEEAFFRGYVQTRLHDAFGEGREILGLRIDLRVLLLQALLFAVIHFVSIPNPARLAVFFPALLFGVLRAWRGGVGAAILVHAMSNVLSEILQLGWLR